MAVIMTSEILRNLIEKAEKTGCTISWIEAESGFLALGNAPGKPQLFIDFAHERLIPAKLPATKSYKDKNPETSLEGKGADALAHHPQAPALMPLIETKWVQDIREMGADQTVNRRRTGHFSLILDGTRYNAPSQKILLLGALERIESLRPGTLGKLAAEKGRTKRVVARTREQLYSRRPDLAEKFAEPISGGWWVATNNNFQETEKFIRRAGYLAGIMIEIQRLP